MEDNSITPTLIATSGYHRHPPSGSDPQIKHPELRSGERFAGNDSFPFPFFEHLKDPTKRLGEVAYCPRFTSKLSPSMRPVFLRERA